MGDPEAPARNVVAASDAQRRHYDRYYSGQPSAWRASAAPAKADNVTALCAGQPHARIAEIGAGDGALLAELSLRGFGDALFAAEISESGLRAIRSRQLPRLVEAVRFDGASLPWSDASFDLAILCHVLEHAEHPRQLLAEAVRVATHVFVEVPLEDTWRLPRDFTPDPVGHINFYSPKSLRRFLQTCGLEILAERVVIPARASLVLRSRRLGAHKHSVKRWLLAAAPWLATRVLTYHGAVLCRAAPGSPLGDQRR